jgi:hypothetical protein
MHSFIISTITYMHSFIISTQVRMPFDSFFCGKKSAVIIQTEGHSYEICTSLVMRYEISAQNSLLQWSKSIQ